MTAIIRRKADILKLARDLLESGSQVEILPDGTIRAFPAKQEPADEHSQVSMK